MNIFKKIKAYLRYHEAVKQAEKAHESTGHRYYVMPMSGTKGKLIIMDRDNFRKLKVKGYISQNARVKHLELECFYCTSYRKGNGRLSPEDIKSKKELFYQWFEHTNK